jgi:AmmeMemoRadiSam system protein A
VTNELPALLNAQEGQLLLQVARQALVEAVQEGREWRPDLASLPPRLQEPGCSFVTLYTGGSLHGCIGTVVPLRPLALDTAHNAVSAALHDPRFPPLMPDELPETTVEVSVLGPMQPISYRDLDDLIAQIKPGRDGVLLRQGWRRGLLLPQVWEQISSPREFLSHVARKAGLSLQAYGAPDAEVFTFQVQVVS